MKGTKKYGEELGAGIKKGMQGLNTACSPKKRKTCIRLIVIPLLAMLILTIIGVTTKNETAIGLLIIPILAMGASQFYVGKFKRGLFYSLTFGGFIVCSLIDLFKLTVTRTFTDANGFPVIY